MNRKLLLTHPINNTLKEKLKTELVGWDLITATTEEEWKNHLLDTEIILGWREKFDFNSVSNNKNLKWVQTWSAGVNSLPLKDLSDQNVAITSANGVHAFPISETIFALMLGLTRNIHTYVRNQTKKEWDNRDLTLEMHNKTIGIIGVGAIGKETAKIAKAFGMHVIGVRNSASPEPYVDSMHTSAQLDEILPLCDYVVVTLPLTESTYQLFQAQQFKCMKNTSFFINIGRGGLVKEDDLIHALESGEILGAGLDVFEIEPLPHTNKLWEFDNVIVTPHTSGSTEHYDSRVIEDIFLPNLARYLKQEPLYKNVVDYQKGY